MKILVTGATGFMGGHLVEELLPLGHELLCMGREERNIHSGVTYKFVDLRDFEKAGAIIREFAPEVVYHLAANSMESTGEHSPIEMTTNGYNTFFTTLTASIQGKHLKKFIYVSSAAVYGNIRTPYTEDQQPQPHDIYAISKYANELSLQVMARTYGFSYVIARPHNITGEGQDPCDPRRNVVPMFMQLLRLGKSPKIHGKGDSKRCYTYVKDVAKALVLSLDKDNVIYNIGSDEETTIQQLYEAIVEVSDIHIDAEYTPPRTNDVKINTVSHSKAKQLFDIPTTSFQETIRKTWEWVSRQPLKSFKLFQS